MRLSSSWLGVIVVVGIGCGGGGGATCMPSADISGLWSGSATRDDVARGENGTVNAGITQTACTLGGTWTFSFADPLLDRQLEITGNAPQTAAVEMDLKECTGLSGSCDTVAPCVFRAVGTLVSATEISGTYATGDNCSFSEAGSFDITLRSRLTPTPLTTPTALPTLPLPTVTPTP
jgi:hypothetical protein